MNIAAWFSRSGDVALTIDVATAEYILSRLKIAGLSDDPPFYQLEAALEIAVAYAHAGTPSLPQSPDDSIL